MIRAWVLAVCAAVSSAGCCSWYATSGCLTVEEIRSRQADQAALAGWIADERSWVREEAARTMGRSREGSGREPLEARAGDRAERAFVRAAAVEALGAIADPRSIGLLAGIAEQPDAPPEVKIAVVRALCAFAGDEPLAAIAPLSRNEDVLVAAIASAQLSSSCGRGR